MPLTEGLILVFSLVSFAESISLKGCQIVAGGRSIAETTGRQENEEHPGRALEKRWHPAGVRYINTLGSGGLRFAATTGYFRSTLRVRRAAGRRCLCVPEPVES